MASGITRLFDVATAPPAAVLALTLFAVACGSGSTATIATTAPTVSTDAAETTGTTVEASTDDATETPATTAAPVPSADDPAWTGQELVLNTIAEADSPLALVSRSGTGDLYIANKSGTVQRIARTTSKNRPDSFSIDNTPVLDISAEVSGGNEQGLLDLVFSSDGRKLYVSYTNRDGDNVIDRYDMGSRTARTDSRFQVLQLEQPFANHNGGGITFGPDGFLYVGLGDGGQAGDPLGSGQDTTTLLGSILRIDPDGATGGAGYAVPNGNPFIDGGGAPEVWLYGVRNPWRFSFDTASGALWIADVGQNEFEEVNRLVDGGRGANLGWNLVEGNSSFDGGTAPANHTSPFLSYAHENNRCSVTGGYVYRGQTLPLYDGVYIFGDFCSGEVFGLADSPAGTIWRQLNLQLGRNELSAFGVDNDGELYVLNIDGTVNRVEPTQADIDAAKAAAEADDG